MGSQQDFRTKLRERARYSDVAGAGNPNAGIYEGGAGQPVPLPCSVERIRVR